MTRFLQIRKNLIERYRCFNCLFCCLFFLSLASNSPWGLKRTPKSSLSSSYHTFCFSIDTEVVLWRLSLTDSFSRKSCSIVPNFPPTYLRKRLLFRSPNTFCALFEAFESARFSTPVVMVIEFSFKRHYTFFGVCQTCASGASNWKMALGPEKKASSPRAYIFPMDMMVDKREKLQ